MGSAFCIELLMITHKSGDSGSRPGTHESALSRPPVLSVWAEVLACVSVGVHALLRSSRLTGPAVEEVTSVYRSTRFDHEQELSTTVLELFHSWMKCSTRCMHVEALVSNRSEVFLFTLVVSMNFNVHGYMYGEH